MKSNFFSIVSLAFLFVSCQAQPAKNVHVLDVKSYAAKLKTTESPQLLDVRSPEEFSSGHIDNAENVNWNDAAFVSNVQKLDKTKPVFVYCKAGGRSAKAANKLSELGFTEIYNLEGGMDKWTQTKSTN